MLGGYLDWKLDKNKGQLRSSSSARFVSGSLGMGRLAAFLGGNQATNKP